MSDTENNAPAPHLDGRLEDPTPEGFNTNTTLPPHGEAGYLGAPYYDKREPDAEEKAPAAAAFSPEVGAQLLAYFGPQGVVGIEGSIDQTTGVAHISLLNDAGETVIHDTVENMVAKLKGSSTISNLDAKQKVLEAFGGETIVFDDPAVTDATEMVSFAQVFGADGNLLAQNTLKNLADQADSLLAARALQEAAEAANPEDTAIAAANVAAAESVVTEQAETSGAIEEAKPDAPAVAQDPENA